VEAFSSLNEKMVGGLVWLMKLQKQSFVVELIDVTDVGVSGGLIYLWNKSSDVEACYLFVHQVFSFN
jgi:hypothetical protein